MFGAIVTYVLIGIGVLMIAIAVIWVLQQRRSPQSALAWILFIVTLPYLGVPLFYAFGVRKRGGGYAVVGFDPDPDAPAVHPLDTRLRQLGAPPARGGNEFRFLPGADAARTALEALIAGAETRIDVALYRLDPDPVSRDFVRQLIAATERGVEVRVILDQFGTWRRPRAQLDELEVAGGSVKLFSARPQLAATGRVNLRNHRKMVMADGQRLWSGGRNIGKTYLGPEEAAATWHDLSFFLAGPAVFRYAEMFEADWQKVAPDAPLRRPRPVPASGTAQVQVVASGPDVDNDPMHDALVHAIHNAEQRIWIATPYFLPTDQLHHALLTAARLGRDLRLLVPAKSNQPVADFARGAYLRDLDEAGARVLRSGPRMMHAKAMVIDDVAWIGSANLDVRSMLLNFEAMLVLYDRRDVDAVAGWFDSLATQSAPGLRPAHLPRRLAEATFRLGAPIL